MNIINRVAQAGTLCSLTAVWVFQWLVFSSWPVRVVGPLGIVSSFDLQLRYCPWSIQPALSQQRVFPSNSFARAAPAFPRAPSFTEAQNSAGLWEQVLADPRQQVGASRIHPRHRCFLLYSVLLSPLRPLNSLPPCFSSGSSRDPSVALFYLTFL